MSPISNTARLEAPIVARVLGEEEGEEGGEGGGGGGGGGTVILLVKATYNYIFSQKKMLLQHHESPAFVQTGFRSTSGPGCPRLDSPRCPHSEQQQCTSLHWEPGTRPRQQRPLLEWTAAEVAGRRKEKQ